jgi:hypothetical protein
MIEKNGHQSQPTSWFTHRTFDFYGFPQDMPLEEAFEQGDVVIVPREEPSLGSIYMVVFPQTRYETI